VGIPVTDCPVRSASKAPLRKLHQPPPALGIGCAPCRTSHFDECVFGGVEGVAAMVLMSFWNAWFIKRVQARATLVDESVASTKS
jgi:hypothetical protein